MQEKILLIDGFSILNRAYYGVPPLTNSLGEPTGGVYGFMNIIYKIIDEERPRYIAVAFDRHEPTFRHIKFPDYKGTRKPMPDDLHAQVPVLKNLLHASGIKTVELAGYEADDIIGTLSRVAERAGMKAEILSGDRDLLQLVTDNVTQHIPRTKSGVTTTEVFTPQMMQEVYGVTPLQYIDVKALQGDSSDNIPGVPGVGEKTAGALIAKYHSLEEIKNHIDEVTPTRAKNAIAEHFDMALMSRELATICLEVPIEKIITDEAASEQAGEKAKDSKKEHTAKSYSDREIIESFEVDNLYTNEAYLIIGKLELKKLMKRFSDKGVTGAPVVTNEKTVSIPKAEIITINGMDASEAEKAFADVAGKTISVTTDNYFDDRCLVMTADCKTVYKITLAWMIDDEFIKSHLDEHAKNAKIVTLGLARLLREFDLIESENYFDAEIAAYLLNPLQNTYSYEDIARDYLGGLVLPTRDEVFDKKNMPKEDDERFINYVSRLVSVPLLAMDEMNARLNDSGMKELFEKIEMPTAFKLYGMEKVGVRVNKEELAEYGEKLTGEIDKLEKIIYKLAGCEFNINSPKQLGEILFEKLGLPGGKKTKSGFSTAADVLEKLKADNEIVKYILEYRTYAKLRSTYAEGLSGFISEDGRIHGHFLQTVTATGRISSADPNLQNIPVREELGREIRKVFIPREGCVFIDADYSQIELRVLAHYSGDEKLIAAYNSDADIHRITASEVFGVALSDVTSEMRRAAKAVNFGIVYGESAFGLSEGLGISRKEANDYINKYFATYPGVKAFLDSMVLDAKNNGYVKTLYGRRRPVPELKSSNFMQRQFGERVAMNSPIQGTAADIMKLAMIAVTDELKRRNLDSKVVLQIHDELLLEVPFAQKDEVLELLRQKMSKVANLRVPLEVSIETGGSWFETK